MEVFHLQRVVHGINLCLSTAIRNPVFIASCRPTVAGYFLLVVLSFPVCVSETDVRIKLLFHSFQDRLIHLEGAHRFRDYLCTLLHREGQRIQDVAKLLAHHRDIGDQRKVIEGQTFSLRESECKLGEGSQDLSAREIS